MNKFYMLVGLPGSGKSTIAQKLNCKVFSSDSLRKELWGNENTQGDNSQLFNELLKERVAEAANSAAFTIDEHSKALTKKVEELQKEVESVKDDIRFERGFRKFFFWLTPALLLAQSIMTAMLLLR